MTHHGFLADAILILHLCFILFVTAGGFLVLHWPRLAWLHLPCLAWAVMITFTARICPLTPLEISLRQAAGEPGYSGDFIDRYLMPVIYPPGLTRELQIGLGLSLLLLNGILYTLYWRRRRKAARPDRGTPTDVDFPGGND